jgi:DNA-binding XRE family transcriptional regulator
MIIIFRYIVRKKIDFFTENIFMETKFWSNLDQARKEVGKERKAVIEECDLPNNAFTQGIRRKSDPSVSTAYRCARSVNKTIEELFDGEAGEQYLREYVQEKGWEFSPPGRIANIVAAASLLSDEQLDYVMGLIKAMLDKKEGSGTQPDAKSGRKTG